MSSIDFNSRHGLFAGADLTVNIVSPRQALGAIASRAQARKGYTLFTVNLDHLVKLKKDRGFCEAYERADFVTADGWPIVWLLQKSGGVDRGLERTTGADLVEPACAQAAEAGVPVYFIGPSPASQASALKILSARYPGLVVSGAETPQLPAKFDDESAGALAARIIASGARLCVVSLGAPKQELLADALHKRCPDVGFLCVGAALDFISGHARRAPSWMRRSGLEWFWRLANDPGRLARRYADCGLAFFDLAYAALSQKDLRLKVAHLDHADSRAL